MAGSKGGRLKKGEEVVLDLEDESNRAFHLIRKKHNFLTYRTNPFSFPCHHLPHLSPPPNCPSSSQTTGIQPWSTYHPGTPVHQCQYHLPITETLAAHATMMQVSGEGEANRQNMVLAAKALMMGMEWEKKICPDYLWRKVREDHPAILNPMRQKHNEDRWVDWLTYKNVNDWTDQEKAYLVELGMVKNEPG
mmetsp:Transcript_11460/g.17411  ORF Transcript_11460/g.17411 Transcript_11460/m.17411 type:complete len:192 (+) Transcript_11460:313-888(+)